MARIKHVLITGGAGFIGLHLTRRLLREEGTTITILDNFSPQIHSDDILPDDIAGRVNLIKADINEKEVLKYALGKVDTIVHLAAETGTGQSMYEIEKYFSTNVQGTAILLDLLQNHKSLQNIKTIVVASSRAVYGEGAYKCNTHGTVYPDQRSYDSMSCNKFEPVCPLCSEDVEMKETSEDASFKPMSVYALTKQIQEQAILMFAKVNKINAFALRYQNVYGPGQSLKNPYTGILAVFSNLARQNQPIDIYEDGLESRDFVYIDDVVEVTASCIDFEGKFVGALNVGSGEPIDVMTVAKSIKSYFSSESVIKVTGEFRVGDIRHNVADMYFTDSLLKIRLERTPFKVGLLKFLDWASLQKSEDKKAYLRSVQELSSKGLMGKQIEP